jgi:hypothetical protein
MVSLDTTTRWVVMLLVAGGVGLIGGVAAALLETKANFNDKPPNRGSWLLNGIVCVFVGGVAAVAVIYFFIPVKELIPKGGGKPEAYYELIKLVPLSLIVGSAGTYFLKSFQQQIEGRIATQSRNVAVANSENVVGAAQTLSAQTETTLDGTKPNFQVLLQDEVPALKLRPEEAGNLADKLVDEAKKATNAAIQPQVETIERLAEGLPAKDEQPAATI